MVTSGLARSAASRLEAGLAGAATANRTAILHDRRHAS
jgi:hypothetical protein